MSRGATCWARQSRLLTCSHLHSLIWVRHIATLTLTPQRHHGATFWQCRPHASHSATDAQCPVLRPCASSPWTEVNFFLQHTLHLHAA